MLAGAVFALFMAFGRWHASKSFSESFALRLMGVTRFGPWIEEVTLGFDKWFGKDHWTLNCFARSSIASVISALLIYFLLTRMGVLELRSGSNLSLIQVIAFGLAINVVPDYLSLWQTRFMLRVFTKVKHFLLQLIILILDLFVTALIITLFMHVFLYIRNEETNLADVVAIFSVYAIFFYSTFLTSIWAWWYFLSNWFLWIFTNTRVGNALNIEEKPWEQAGLVAALVVSVFGYLGPIALSEAQHRANMLVCLTSTDFSCRKAVDLTETQGEEEAFVASRAAELFSTLCPGGVQNCRSPTHALTLAKRACDEGYRYYCYIHGDMIQRGIGINPNIQLAMNRFELACDQEVAAGCTAGMDLLIKEIKKNMDNDDLIDVNNSNFVRLSILSKKACDQGSISGCSLYGMYGSANPGFDEMEAHAAFDKVCEGGATFGCAILASLKSNNGEDKSIFLSTISRACDGGKDCSTLGSFLLHGISPIFEKNPTLAENAFVRGCDLGEAQSCYELGVYLSNDQNQAERELGLLDRGCLLSSGASCHVLARKFMSGVNVEENKEKAISLYSKACELGEMSAFASLGWFTLAGAGTERNPSKAKELLDKSCEGGDAAGCKFFAVVIAQGSDGSEPDKTRAAELYEKACELGSSRGCVNFAEQLEKGEGVPIDVARAIHLYEIGCADGDQKGCSALGTLQVSKSEDLEATTDRYSNACDAGDAKACQRVGRSHHFKTSPDYSLAESYYTKGCDLGEAASCNDLAWLLEPGRGEKTYPERSVELYGRACDSGYLAGCNNLGRMKREGVGTAVDEPGAIVLFTKACAGGFQLSCEKMQAPK